MGFRVDTRGSFQKTFDFLDRMKRREQFNVLHKYGQAGVVALSAATPMETGETANSWYYEIVQKSGYFAIHWYNSHVEDPGRVSIAAILQYGHATRGGGHVEGIDYINPAMRPIFEQAIADMWKEVTK